MGCGASTEAAPAAEPAAPAAPAAANKPAVEAEPEASAEPAAEEAASDVPAVVSLFFDGEQISGKAEALAALYAEEFTISFVGPFTGATTGMVLDREKVIGAMGNLNAAFPDLTFNKTKEAVEKNEEGGWGAKIVVAGCHSGIPFTPMPGMLPPVETTNKEVSIGPELFTMYTNEEGKATKLTIEPLHEGALVGPPGFYVSIGGVLPDPAAAAAAAAQPAAEPEAEAEPAVDAEPAAEPEAAAEPAVEAEPEPEPEAAE
jgi:hypothetical protein